MSNNVKDKINRILTYVHNNIFDFMIEMLGVNPMRSRRFVRGECPVHGGDRRDAFSYHENKMTFHCFTHCGHLGDAIDTYLMVSHNINNVEFKELKELRFEQPETMKTYNRYMAEAINDIEKWIEGRNSNIHELREVRTKQTGGNEEIIIDLPNVFDTIKTAYFKNDPKKTSTYFRINFGKVQNINQIQRLTNGVWQPRFSMREIIDNYILIGRNRWDRYFFYIIKDVRGQIVGYQGRYLGDYKKDDKPKSLNTPQPFYSSSVLYNLYKYPRNIKHLVITEGPADAIAVARCGFNAVSTLGKVLHPAQFEILKNHLSPECKIIMLYDGDKEGLIWSPRAASILKDYFKDVSIVRLPNELDPEEAYWLPNFDLKNYVINNHERI